MNQARNRRQTKEGQDTTAVTRMIDMDLPMTRRQLGLLGLAAGATYLLNACGGSGSSTDGSPGKPAGNNLPVFESLEFKRGLNIHDFKPGMTADYRIGATDPDGDDLTYQTRMITMTGEEVLKRKDSLHNMGLVQLKAPGLYLFGARVRDSHGDYAEIDGIPGGFREHLVSVHGIDDKVIAYERDMSQVFDGREITKDELDLLADGSFFGKYMDLGSSTVGTRLPWDLFSSSEIMTLQDIIKDEVVAPVAILNKEEPTLEFMFEDPLERVGYPDAVYAGAGLTDDAHSTYDALMNVTKPVCTPFGKGVVDGVLQYIEMTGDPTHTVDYNTQVVVSDKDNPGMCLVVDCDIVVKELNKGIETVVGYALNPCEQAIADMDRADSWKGPVRFAWYKTDDSCITDRMKRQNPSIVQIWNDAETRYRDLRK